MIIAFITGINPPLGGRGAKAAEGDSNHLSS